VIEGFALQLLQHDYTWLTELFLLLLLPFAREDLAIIAGAFVVVHHEMPAVAVALCIYAGTVASDLALYAFGTGARRVPWLARLALETRALTVAKMLRGNLLGLVAFGRVVPGVGFSVFIACGWARAPLSRFIGGSMLVSALYLPLMLCIAVFIGDALHEQIGRWTWPTLIALVLALGYFRQRVFGLQEPAEPTEASATADGRARRNDRAARLAPVAYAWSRQRRRPRPGSTAAETRASASRA
jgi:membrane protein DedA with SNARE-associated domain